MKTFILTLGLIVMSLSMNAQRITIKTNNSSRYTSQTRYGNYNDRNSIGASGHIEISTKGGWKFKFKNNSTSNNQDPYRKPISQKQLQKEKVRIETLKNN